MTSGRGVDSVPIGGLDSERVSLLELYIPHVVAFQTPRCEEGPTLTAICQADSDSPMGGVVVTVAGNPTLALLGVF